MADDLSIDEWTTFLKARINQEKGNDEQALQTFEQLLISHPRNPHLLSSRAIALKRLNRPDMLMAKVAAEYAELGRTLVGPNDKPDVWVDKLTELLSATQTKDSDAFVASSLVAW